MSTVLTVSDAGNSSIAGMLGVTENTTLNRTLKQTVATTTNCTRDASGNMSNLGSIYL